MNDKCDVLVGHGDKISILKAEDYYPHWQPKPLESEEIVEMTDKMFYKLKQWEEQSKQEAMARNRKAKQKPYYELN